jgi:hypothetical protein
LLAAALKAGGGRALFAVTPIAGALLVWFAFVAARALAGPLAGMMAALLVACSPIVLFQVVQPMNDVTTAMLWTAAFAALVSRRWATAGVCCGLALLVRPNLLPLGIIAGSYALLADLKTRSVRAALAFSAAALPFLMLVLWLNNALYGGPLRSGYGQLDQLFSATHLPTNAARYPQWLIQTQSVLVFLGLLAPWAVERSKRGAVWLGLALIGATVAIYLAYTPFDDWSYLRFLLPAVSLLIVLMSVAIARAAAAAGRPIAVVLVVLVAAALAIRGVAVARDRLAFQMTALEQRYRTAGMVARDRLPSGAAILTTWDSGAIRFHAHKEAIVWDALDAAWLDRALAWLSQHGYQPFILVESWEEPLFRERFAATSRVGKLDWPPKYEVDRAVRIYDPQDREKYMRGQPVVTEYVWPLLKSRK